MLPGIKTYQINPVILSTEDHILVKSVGKCWFLKKYITNVGES